MLSGKPKKERRSGLDRRQFSYDLYIPERRSGRDQRGDPLECHRIYIVTGASIDKVFHTPFFYKQIGTRKVIFR